MAQKIHTPVSASHPNYLGGVAAHKANVAKHGVSNVWQSWNAIDFGVSANSKVYAVRTGTIKNIHAASGKYTFGWAFYLYDDWGQVWYYEHTRKPSVKNGARVHRGQFLCKLAVDTKNGIPTHLHLAIKKGSPHAAFGVDKKNHIYKK